MKKTIYWKGDKAEFTGNVTIMHKGLFHEIKLLEGHLEGSKKWVSHDYFLQFCEAVEVEVVGK